jgi:hypothetical protein
MSEQEAFEKLLKMHEDAKRVRLAYLVTMARFAEDYNYKIDDVEKMVWSKTYGV